MAVMYVWDEWPAFFRGAEAVMEQLRASRSPYAVRARLIALALSVGTERTGDHPQ